jgi:puromycin-sensitive aminopeptidase
MGLVSHQWAFVRSGTAPIQSVLEIVAALGHEQDAHVLATLRAPLGFLADQIAPAAGAATLARFRAWVVDRFGHQLEALGWEPAADESDEVKLRRAAVLGILGEVASGSRGGRSRPPLRLARQPCEPRAESGHTVATLAAWQATPGLHDPRCSRQG